MGSLDRTSYIQQNIALTFINLLEARHIHQDYASLAPKPTSKSICMVFPYHTANNDFVEYK